MNYWVIMDVRGLFVSAPGNESSYTSVLQRAAVYTSRKRAEAHCNDDESVVKLFDLIRIVD